MLNINNLELEKELRKLSKRNKENFDTLQARENRKLNIKVKKYVSKAKEENRNDDL